MFQLYSILDLVETLRLSKRTIYRAIESGELKGLKVGRIWRFSEKDVERWLKRKEQ